MQTVDLCQTDDVIHWNAFLTLLQEAQDPSHNKLAENYINLEEKVREHDAFHLLLDEEEPIAFAGLYNNGIYHNAIARALNRTYVASSVRLENGMQAFREHNTNHRRNFILTRKILPYQVEIARKSRDGVFISIESKRRVLKAVVNAINKYSDDRWQILPDMYFTCPRIDECRINPACWQNVALLSFRSFDFPLDNMTIEKWKRLFSE